MSNWIELTKDTLPEPNTLVWIKRTKGMIYLGRRQDQPLSENPDASRETYWNASPANDLSPQRFGMEFKHEFSDVTVTHWQYPTPPQK